MTTSSSSQQQSKSFDEETELYFNLPKILSKA